MASKPKVPRQHSAAARSDVHNITDPMPGQTEWSVDNLPGILYVFRPTAPQVRTHIQLPTKPSLWEGESNLRALDILPDRISTNVEEFRVEAWMRLDRRILLEDITKRMNPKLRISNNALQQRSVRFRQAFHILSWGTGNKKTQETAAEIDRKLRKKGIDPAANSTRGLTPGLINPALGEAGGRIPVPEAYGQRLRTFAIEQQQLIEQLATMEQNGMMAQLRPREQEMGMNNSIMTQPSMALTPQTYSPEQLQYLGQAVYESHVQHSTLNHNQFQGMPYGHQLTAIHNQPPTAHYDQQLSIANSQLSGVHYGQQPPPVTHIHLSDMPYNQQPATLDYQPFEMTDEQLGDVLRQLGYGSQPTMAHNQPHEMPYDKHPAMNHRKLPDMSYNQQPAITAYAQLQDMRYGQQIAVTHNQLSGMPDGLHSPVSHSQHPDTSYDQYSATIDDTAPETTNEQLHNAIQQLPYPREEPQVNQHGNEYNHDMLSRETSYIVINVFDEDYARTNISQKPMHEGHIIFENSVNRTLSGGSQNMPNVVQKQDDTGMTDASEDGNEGSGKGQESHVQAEKENEACAEAGVLEALNVPLIVSLGEDSHCQTANGREPAAENLLEELAGEKRSEKDRLENGRPEDASFKDRPKETRLKQARGKGTIPKNIRFEKAGLEKARVKKVKAKKAEFKEATANEAETKEAIKEEQTTPILVPSLPCPWNPWNMDVNYLWYLEMSEAMRKIEAANSRVDKYIIYFEGKFDMEGGFDNVGWELFPSLAGPPRTPHLSFNEKSESPIVYEMMLRGLKYHREYDLDLEYCKQLEGFHEENTF
ncbi:hypothetical protein GX48_02275 [Paracoccidioides brasiliensis]|nr:hypothetical protein GX48_02275 [Paracoccidioides brasiliensis]